MLVVVSFFNHRLDRRKVAQQSVQRIFGSLRGLQVFFWLGVFPAPKHYLSPPTCG